MKLQKNKTKPVDWLIDPELAEKNSGTTIDNTI